MTAPAPATPAPTPSLTVIDYGGGNVGSLTRALERLNAPFVVTPDPEQIASAAALVLPGDGHFGFVMESLNRRALTPAIINTVTRGTPFLGICVGMQILFEDSAEAPGVQGLGLISGKVHRFNAPKVPQIGWNRCERGMAAGRSLPSSGFAYFVNSFFCDPINPKLIGYRSDYFGEFAAGVVFQNITAYQFHPEKSGNFGMELLRGWIAGLATQRR